MAKAIKVTVEVENISDREAARRQALADVQAGRGPNPRPWEVPVEVHVLRK